MEGIQALLDALWTELATKTIPIINLTFVQFFIAVFALKLLIAIFNYLLSKSNKDNGNKDK